MKPFAADLWVGMRTAPGRTGLAFFSLALGWFSATVLTSTLEALQRQARGLVEDFGAETFAVSRAEAAGTESWTRRHADYFRANLGEDCAATGLRTVPRGGEENPIVATDEELAKVRGWKWVDGRGLDKMDVRMGARHAVASETTCQTKGWKTGQIVRLGKEPFRLVGQFKGGGAAIAAAPEHGIYVPHTAARFGAGSAEELEKVDVLVFRAAAGARPEALRRRVERLLGQPGARGAGVVWTTPETLLVGIRRWQRAIGWTAGTGGALAVLLGGAALAGTLMAGVRERVPEIGLRRALGARKRDVAGLFVAEALALAGAAAIAGAAGAETALRLLGDRFPLPFHFGWWVRLLPLGMSAALALACAAAPAWRAARMPPAEALRNE